VREIKKKLSLQIEDIPNFISQDFPIDLISTKSIQIFDRFNIKTIFLSLDPIYWLVNEEYKKAKEFIGSL